MSAADEIRRLLLNMSNGATAPIRRICAAELNAYFYNNAESIAELIEAAAPALHWMEWWLYQDLCECEGAHTCGKTERRAELEALKQALAKLNTGNGEE